MSRKIVRDGLELFALPQHRKEGLKEDKKRVAVARRSDKQLQTRTLKGAKNAHSSKKNSKKTKRKKKIATTMASSKSGEDFLAENLALLRKQKSFRQHNELIQKVTLRNTPRWHNSASIYRTNDANEINTSESANDIDYDFNATL